MNPFLRWAGGKMWLKKYIDNVVNINNINNYHEPFLGGGSMFFHLDFSNDCFLSDLNEELINTYVQVRDNVKGVIQFLQSYENTSEFYYDLRPRKITNPIERAAQFIYLNQTSFNGLYRVNLDGIYNVPYGNRTKDFVQEELLLKASIKLQNVVLESKQFDANIDNIKARDLIFLDPPYTITHNNNGFIKYNEKLFKEEDQHRLSSFIDKLVEIGAFFVLTNAAHNRIREIFNQNEPIRLTRASLISGEISKRGKYEEFLFTNIQNDYIKELKNQE